MSKKIKTPFKIINKTKREIEPKEEFIKIYLPSETFTSKYGDLKVKKVELLKIERKREYGNRKFVTYRVFFKPYISSASIKWFKIKRKKVKSKNKK